MTSLWLLYFQLYLLKAAFREVCILHVLPRPLFFIVVVLFHLTEFTFCVLFHEKEIDRG